GLIRPMLTTNVRMQDKSARDLRAAIALRITRGRRERRRAGTFSARAERRVPQTPAIACTLGQILAGGRPPPAPPARRRPPGPRGVRGEMPRSERVMAVAGLDGDPPELGELGDGGLAAEAAVAGVLHAAERYLHSSSPVSARNRTQETKLPSPRTTSFAGMLR